MFHEKCDSFKKVLILVETDESERFGGFTSHSFDFSKKDQKWIPDGFNFLFSLTNKKIFY
jgi:hypothetical protein